MTISAEHRSNLQPYTGNGDVSKWVKNSPVGRKNPNKQKLFCWLSDFSLINACYFFNWEDFHVKDFQSQYNCVKCRWKRHIRTRNNTGLSSYKCQGSSVATEETERDKDKSVKAYRVGNGQYWVKQYLLEWQPYWNSHYIIFVNTGIAEHWSGPLYPCMCCLDISYPMGTAFMAFWIVFLSLDLWQKTPPSYPSTNEH